MKRLLIGLRTVTAQDVEMAETYSKNRHNNVIGLEPPG